MARRIMAGKQQADGDQDEDKRNSRRLLDPARHPRVVAGFARGLAGHLTSPRSHPIYRWRLYRDTMSRSRRNVSNVDIAVATPMMRRMPRLWTDTIEAHR